jgi:TrmH family RNA methyltransferase
MIITSTANPKVKWIRSLRERKFRQETGFFYVEGLRLVIEAVQMEAGLHTLIAAPELLKSENGIALLEKQRNAGVEVIEVSKSVFHAIALKEDPVGLAAVVAQRWLPLPQITVKAPDLWVALDRVADPGNLGTILRTIDAVGGRGIILLDQCTDPYDPTSVRASMGALFGLNLAKASFTEFSTWKKSGHVVLVGTSDQADCDYQTYSYPAGMVLLMGSEREGLSGEHMALCDQMISIPMSGRSDSLNLAVAAAVTLYEIFNQKRRKKGLER